MSVNGTSKRTGPDPSRILNYTTEVPVAKTLGEIRAILVAHKVRSITDVYEGGKVVALEFVFDTGWGPRPFLLPAKPAAVLALMIERRNTGRSRYDRFWIDAAKPPQALIDQAERTGWRTIKDWLEAQMALMVTRQVTFEQIFLPYALVDGDRTMFDVYSESQKRLPAPDSAKDS